MPLLLENSLVGTPVKGTVWVNLSWLMPLFFLLFSFIFHIKLIGLEMKNSSSNATIFFPSHISYYSLFTGKKNSLILHFGTVGSVYSPDLLLTTRQLREKVEKIKPKYASGQEEERECEWLLTTKKQKQKQKSTARVNESIYKYWEPVGLYYTSHYGKWKTTKTQISPLNTPQIPIFSTVKWE